MLFGKTSIGVEVSSSGVAFALMGGTDKAPRLERVAYGALAPGVVRASLREPNVLEPQAFIDCFCSAHNLLLSKTKRLSVTLPDAVGRTMLLDMEGRFKSRNEGLDMIRWKLKKNIPFDIADTHLDYQQLRIRENGDIVLLVALVSRTVIEQYEDLFVTAGFMPSRIDFTSLSLSRIFGRRLAFEDDSLQVFFYNNTLGIMAYHEGAPDFLRIKELPGALAAEQRVFMEINRSLLVYRERFPERETPKLFCSAPPDAARDFCEMVTEAAGIESSFLEIKSFVTPADEAPGDQETLFRFSAAIGAAMRNL